MIRCINKFCKAWDMIYIKSNGRIPCWCDAGEPHTILHESDFGDVDFVRDIVNSRRMIEMRKTLLLRNKSYIDECNSCAMFQDENHGPHFRFIQKDLPSEHDILINQSIKHMNLVHKKRKWPYGSIDIIKEIQLEPSFVCNLKCPGCIQGAIYNPLSTEEKPYQFPYEWFVNMIKSIKRHSVVIKKIVFLGKGEPTLNKHLPQMIKHARMNIGKIIMNMDTNANQTFLPEYLFLDNINCSIDGCDQDSYSRYRRGGVFDKTIKFMSEGVKLKESVDKTITSKTCNIKWKYILFEGNDSDEQLNEAQKIARSLNIDQLCFIITQGPLPSLRYKNLESIISYINKNKIFPRTTCNFAT